MSTRSDEAIPAAVQTTNVGGWVRRTAGDGSGPVQLRLMRKCSISRRPNGKCGCRAQFKCEARAVGKYVSGSGEGRHGPMGMLRSNVTSLYGLLRVSFAKSRVRAHGKKKARFAAQSALDLEGREPVDLCFCVRYMKTRQGGLCAPLCTESSI